MKKKLDNKKLKFKAKKTENIFVKFKSGFTLLIIFSVFFISFFLSGSIWIDRKNNNDNLKNLQITLIENEIEISNLLKKIAFNYNIKIYSNLEINEKVSVHLRNVTIYDALKEIFKNSNYTFEIKNNNIIIKPKEKETNLKSNFKRVVISPTFISVEKVVEIAKSICSTDAKIDSNEKYGYVVIYDRSEIIDTLMEKINKIDTPNFNSNDVQNNLEQIQTKLFVLKSINLKNIINEISQFLSQNGEILPNYDLNSVIISDTQDVLNKINDYILKIEKKNNNLVLSCKIFKIETKYLNELIKLEYVKPINNTSNNLSFFVINNKSHFNSLIEKYLIYNSDLTLLNEKFLEIKTCYNLVNTQFKIQYDNDLKINNLKIKTIEELKLLDQQIQFNTININSNLVENNLIMIYGFEKSLISIVNLLCNDEYLEYICNTDKIINNLNAYSKINQDNILVMILSLESKQYPLNLSATYTFINLSHLVNNYYIDSNLDFSQNYLNIFKISNLNEENISKINDIKNTDDTNDKLGKNKNNSIFKIKNKNNKNINEIVFESNKNDNKDNVIKNIKQLIEEQNYKLAQEIALNYIKNNPNSFEAYIALGNIYKEQKKFISAHKAFKKALDISYNSKLAENIKKLEELIAFINDQKSKLDQSKNNELELYLR